MKIKKYSGETVDFSEEKFRNSLIKTGAEENVINQIVNSLEEQLFDGITTRKIYEFAHKELRKKAASTAPRYRLRQAILDLGPTGFPFELFVGEVLRKMDYSIQTGITMQGKCVSHEVDVLADKAHERLMLECKFHNRHGYKTDVKVPMYIQSRFQDLAETWQNDPDHAHKKLIGGVVTNSRFTEDAIVYGSCVGLTMISWNYPKGAGLQDLVEKYELQPITTLRSLKKHDKAYLIGEGIVISRQLCDRIEVLEKMGLQKSQIHKILQEIELICSVNPR